MDGWADGLNYYLYKHPTVKPRVITKFEPWMALTFSEGSIGGDIEGVSLQGIEDFYGPQIKNVGAPNGTSPTPKPISPAAPPGEAGSNGFAIAPSITANHHAILWINPHTSFFFRSEAQAVSEEGLNVYGASTWGQFFMYQGFNDKAGWMHTSSNADVVDEYAETVVQHGDKNFYKYGSEERPFRTEVISVPYRTASGAMATRSFTVYRSHHGPVVRMADGKWIAVKMMQEPMKALMQSYSRTKAHNLQEFLKVMELHSNSSNNTLFADAKGNIAYLHANFVPRRDTSFDWRRPVDGSNPATEWKGLHSVAESPNSINPKNGWAYNTNNWPYTTSGPNSPDITKFPKYFENGYENPRGLHAMRVLSARTDFTPDRVIAAAFDTWMPSFDMLIPPLVVAYDGLDAGSPLKGSLREQIEALRGWDHRWGTASVPTTLAIFWGEELGRRAGPGARGAWVSTDSALVRTTPDVKLAALAAASDRLTQTFGTWKTPWGDINRFQRINGAIVQPFTDAAPSIPVGFPASRWGTLASFVAREYPGTKKRYGTSGNSFLAVVEFGDSVRAKAVTAGGESGDPSSPHFNDQAERYATGNLRDVYFYKNQIAKHTERTYHPGQ
jgi:acyl-homoserine-lactone acylase